MFEVDFEGRILWDYVNPVRATGPVSQGANINNNDVFRAYRYPPDYPAFEGRALEPQGPLELNPLPSDCMVFGDPVSSAHEPEGLSGVKVLSNPVSDRVEVVNETEKQLSLVVFTLTGQRITRALIAPGINRLPSGEWPPGLYLLRVEDKGSGRYFVEKIIKY